MIIGLHNPMIIIITVRMMMLKFEKSHNRILLTQKIMTFVILNQVNDCK